MLDLRGIRRVTDDRGVDWEVWEAHPRLVDRRRARERRAQLRADHPDRRKADSSSSENLPLADAAGWLVFKSGREERRRTPIPMGWEVMSREQLLAVLAGSRNTGPYPRVRQ